MTPRRLLGCALIVAAFALIILFGYGVIEPFGSTQEARDLGGALGAAAPSLLVPLVLFVIGLWLAKGGRRR